MPHSDRKRLRRPFRQQLWLLAKALFIGGLALFVLAVIAATLSFTVLTKTHFGRNFILARAQTALEATFSGRLTVGDFEILPGPSFVLVLDDVRLFGTDGMHIAGAERIEAVIWLPALLRARLEVSRLTTHGLDAQLIERDGVLNLSEAFASKKNSPSKPSSKSVRTDLLRNAELVLRQVDVSGTSSSFMKAETLGEIVRLDDFRIALSGRLSVERFEAVLDLSGKLMAPLERTIDLHAHGSGTPFRHLELQRFTAHLGDSSIHLKGAWQGNEAKLALESLVLDRAEIARLLPSLRPGVTHLSATGAAKLHGALAVALLDVSIGSGSLSLHAQGDLDQHALSATLDLESIAPSDVHDVLPTGSINARLESAWNASKDTSFGSGRLAVELTPSDLGNGKIDGFSASFELAAEHLHLTSLFLSISGMALHGTGTLDLSHLNESRAEILVSNFEFDIASLGKILNQISNMTGIEMPALKGAGQIRVRTQGTLGQALVPLTAEIEATFRRLSMGAFHLEGAVFSGVLPELTRPSVFDGRLRARDAALGALTLRALDLNVRSNGRSFDARMEGWKNAGLALQLNGVISPDFEGLRLDVFDIIMPRLTWRLAHAAILDLKDGIRVDQLELRAEHQSLSLRGGIEGRRLHALLDGRSIDLEMLPTWLMPVFPDLRGQLDLRAELSGMTWKPTGKIHLDARQLGIGFVQALDFSLTGDIQERVQVRFELTQFRQSIHLNADLPRLWEKKPPHSLLSARLDIDAVELDRFADMFLQKSVSDGHPNLARPSFFPTAGQLSGHLEVSGTLGAPTAKIALQTQGLTLGHKFPAFDLDLTALLGNILEATIALELDRGGLDLNARLDLSLAHAIHAIDHSKAEFFLTHPFSLNALWSDLDLEGLTNAWFPEQVRGLLSGELQLSGTPQSPKGSLRVDVRDGALRELSALSLALRLELQSAGLDLNGYVTIASQKILKLSSSLSCPLSSLVTAREPFRVLGNAPFETMIELGPVGLDLLFGPSDPSLGSLEASVSLNGTLDLPQMSLQGTLRDFWLGPQGIGVLRFEGGYRDGRLSIDSKLDRLEKLRMGSIAPLFIEELDSALDTAVDVKKEVPSSEPKSSSTALEWSAALEAELGLTKLIESHLDLRTLPWEISLESQGFQLSWLQGFFSSVQSLSGRLDVSAQVHGPLENPWAQGFLRIQGGTLTSSTLERLASLDALIRLEKRLVRFENIRARSGKGSVTFEGTAEWPASGLPLSLSAALTLERLPLRVNGQRMGTLTSTPIQIAGQLAPEKIDLSLELDRLRFDLAEVNLGKDLQSLEPHKEIEVFSRRDQRAEAKREQSSLALDLTLRAHQIEAISKDLKLKATADLRLRQRDGMLTMQGDLKASEGKAEFFGRAFELESAQLDWNGTPPGEAAIDATILHENAREGVVVKISIGGVLPKPRIELTSEPPHSEQELAMLIATGRLNQKRGTGSMSAGSGAASIVGAFLADRLRRTLSPQLPIDVLQFDLGEEGLTSARIEAGTYLTDDLYLGYRRDFGADPAKENVDEVRIELQLTPSLSIESNYGYGDESRGGIGIIYNKDY